MNTVPIELKVNGRDVHAQIDPRTLLVQLIRDQLHLTGTHVGCDTAQCGCCTVHLDGQAVKSCSILALQAQGKQVTTIEGISQGETLHPVQQAFRDCHGLQCGYCTPGMVMSTIDLLKRIPHPTEDQVRDGLEGNLCRCTGYENIVKSVLKAAEA
jgi:carbon-monoxide dehydrogenase small subunit